MDQKKVKAATMCSIEESREDSNKIKGTRTTEANANFEIYEVQLKNLPREDTMCKKAGDQSGWSSTNLQSIEITSINTTTNTILF